MDIPNMAAKNVLKNYTVTFVRDGKPDAKLRVNAGAYIRNALLYPDPLPDTVTALYRYSTAAANYFGN